MCCIKHANVVYQDSLRPAVADDVVHGEKSYMLLFAKLQQLCANERAVLEIEGFGRLQTDKFLNKTAFIAAVFTWDLHDWQIDAEFRQYNLLRLTICARIETCAQSFVPLHHIIPNALLHKRRSKPGAVFAYRNPQRVFLQSFFSQERVQQLQLFRRCFQCCFHCCFPFISLFASYAVLSTVGCSAKVRSDISTCRLLHTRCEPLRGAPASALPPDGSAIPGAIFPP